MDCLIHLLRHITLLLLRLAGWPYYVLRYAIVTYVERADAAATHTPLSYVERAHAATSYAPLLCYAAVDI